MYNSMVNSTRFDWRSKSKRKLKKKTNKKDISKREFVLITENFTISQEKIHSNAIPIKPTNAEHNGEFNEIRFNIQIKPKIGEQKKQKGYMQEKIRLKDKSFRNLEDKIHWTQIQMTRRNTEFNGELNYIR